VFAQENMTVKQRFSYSFELLRDQHDLCEIIVRYVFFYRREDCQKKLLSKSPNEA